MAVIASASITLTAITDVASTTRYYKLQSSTLAKPAKPTAKPPSGWTTTEPTYDAVATSSLYTCDLTVFSDGTYAYSAVSLSSSYEAAKDAYNQAIEAAKTASNWMEYTSAGLDVGNKTSGAWSGFRSRMAAGAFQVLDAAGSIVASYGAKLIELGKNATDAVISLCGGKGSISYEQGASGNPCPIVIRGANGARIEWKESLSTSGDYDPVSYVSADYGNVNEMKQAEVRIVASNGFPFLDDRDTASIVVQGPSRRTPGGSNIEDAYVWLYPRVKIDGDLFLRNTVLTGDGNWLYAPGIATSKICTNKNSIYPVYGGRILYLNWSGNYGTVTLADTAEGYVYFEIYFATNDGECSSTKTYGPNGRLVNLSSATITGASGAGWVKSKNLYIVGNTMTISGYAGESGMAANTGGTNYNNSIRVIQVVGYK